MWRKLIRVTIDEARAQLSKLIEVVLAGEEVVIAQGDTSGAKLVPVEQGFKLGLLKGDLTEPAPDFLEPMSEDEPIKWEGGV